MQRWGTGVACVPALMCSNLLMLEEVWGLSESLFDMCWFVMSIVQAGASGSNQHSLPTGRSSTPDSVSCLWRTSSRVARCTSATLAMQRRRMPVRGFRRKGSSKGAHGSTCTHCIPALCGAAVRMHPRSLTRGGGCSSLTQCGGAARCHVSVHVSACV